jgi:hypothetical protein
MMELPPIHHAGSHAQLAAVASIVNDQDSIVGGQGPLAEVFSLEQLESQVLENSRQINDLHHVSVAQSLDSLDAALGHGQGILAGDLDLGGKKKSKAKKRKRNPTKEGKEPQLNTCLAVGCERQIKQRRLCPMHQKQKERNNGKIELKENVKFSKGRTPTPFSKHANKYAKLKIFDKKIDEWAGGKEEGSLMLQSFMDSSYYQNRFPKQEDFKIYEQVGKNIIEFMKHLPDKSPLRRPLIKAISEDIPLAKLREVLPVSKQTVLNSKKLPDQENLLLTIRYKPGVTRNRKRSDLDNSVLDATLPTGLEGELAQAMDIANMPIITATLQGPQLEPPHVDTSSQDIIQTGEIPQHHLQFPQVMHQLGSITHATHTLSQIHELTQPLTQQLSMNRQDL